MASGAPSNDVPESGGIKRLPASITFVSLTHRLSSPTNPIDLNACVHRTILAGYQQRYVGNVPQSIIASLRSAFFHGEGGGPIPSRNCSSLALSMDRAVWLFDCAEGTQLQLQRSQLKIGQVERIFITHMHADHTLGLIPLLGSLISGIQSTSEERQAIAARGTQKKAKINIYGPPGLRLMLRQMLNLTAMTLGDVYAVHELIPTPVDSSRTSLVSTSPNGQGNSPSCGCEASDLQAAEAVGQNIVADEDGCWRDIISQAEHPAMFQQGRPSASDSASPNRGESKIWRVDVGPIKHRVLSLGYIIVEPALYEPFDLDATLPQIASQMPLLRERSPPIRHPRQVLSIVSRTRQPFELPDGAVIQPPPLSTMASRKIAILGDCSGTDNQAFLKLIDSPSMLVHECTNAWVDPRIEKGIKADETRINDVVAEDARLALEKIQSKAISRGHSDAQMAGGFAKSVNARRLVVNHFSAMFPSPKFASSEPFPGLTMPAFPLPPGRAAPPLVPAEIAKRMVMSSIETQISAAWLGEEKDEVESNKAGRRACAARDLMIYDLPAHEVSSEEAAVLRTATDEAKRLGTIWCQDGANGFAKETGCKLVGIWPDRVDHRANSQQTLGQLTPGHPNGTGPQAPSTIGTSGETVSAPDAGLSVDGSSIRLRNVQLDAVTVTKPMSNVARGSPSTRSGLTKAAGTSNFHRHPTRHIALLFVYQGWHYSGLAIQQMPTPLPTVEGELLKAFEKTHLIEAGTGWEGCGFSRCGRTDRGVSSAGQVVSLWVKSKRKPDDGGVPLCVGGDWRSPQSPVPDQRPTTTLGDEQLVDNNLPLAVTAAEEIAMRISGEYAAPILSEDSISKLPLRQQLKARKMKSNKIQVPSSEASEYSYPHILNRVLPPEIRVLAWSPLPQEVPTQHAASSDTAHTETAFDARFSCITRHYRYFFSRQPVPDHPPLDIPLMQAAAARLIGEHDFRNFCKVDGSKQIENHCRRVLKAVVRPDDARSLDQIEQADLAGEPLQSSYVFELVGSAFLWHQVRHIMSVLFHVGHGFEDPEVVTRLLKTGYEAVGDVDRNSAASVSREDDNAPVASKPLYVMGAALPLQLYRCGYDSGAIDWRYGGFDGPVSGEHVDEETQTMAREGHMTVLTSLNSQAEEARIKARQIQAFYQEAIEINRPSGLSGELSSIEDVAATSFTLGGGEVQAARKYVKFLDRPRGDPVEEQNRRWREGKGENRRLRKLAESEDRK